MKTVQTLIDKASKACGSDAALARRMGIYPADISNLRAGKRALSPELAAEIADIAGEDARQAAIDAIIERNEKNRKGPLLREILGKAQAAGGAAMCHISYSGDLVNATETIATASVTTRPVINRIYSQWLAIINPIKFEVIARHIQTARQRAALRLPALFGFRCVAPIVKGYGLHNG